MQTGFGMFTDRAILVRPYSGRTVDRGVVSNGVTTVASTDGLLVAITNHGAGVGIEIDDVPFTVTDAALSDVQAAAEIVTALNLVAGIAATQIGNYAHVVLDVAGKVDAVGTCRLIGDAVAIVASVQPINNARDRQLLPEGYRDREAIIVYAAELLSDGSESSGRLADQVLYLDSASNWYQYEVVRVDRYEMGSIDHSEAVAVRLVDNTMR